VCSAVAKSEKIAVPSLPARLPGSTVHQNRSAVKRKLACCKVCSSSLVMVRPYSPGKCQIQIAAPCRTKAASGRETKRHAVETTLDLISAPVPTRPDCGKLHNAGTIGRAATSSGAASTINSSCWAMCAEKRAEPSTCSGETRLIASTSHPAANDAAESAKPAGQRPARARSLVVPTTNAEAESTSRRTTHGSKVHDDHRSCGSGGRPSCAHVARGIAKTAKHARPIRRVVTYVDTG
jgi:hypothetical protein